MLPLRGLRVLAGEPTEGRWLIPGYRFPQVWSKKQTYRNLFKNSKFLCVRLGQNVFVNLEITFYIDSVEETQLLICRVLGVATRE